MSAQPGLVPQEKSQTTRARIWGEIFFVDYASRWVKVHLMQDATGDSMLEAKNAFEQDCMTRNVVPHIIMRIMDDFRKIHSRKIA